MPEAVKRTHREVRETPRIQDAVAKTASVSLRSTVSVLRALAMVAEEMGRKELARELNSALVDSTNNGGCPAVLHAKPDLGAIKACNRIYAALREKHGDVGMRTVTSLKEDPYFNAVVRS